MNDDNVHREVLNIITRETKKCPKYRKGEDFTKYLVRFNFHCEVNKIKEEDKVVELFSQLDENSFEIAIKLPHDVIQDYADTCKHLIERFSHASGPWGDIHRLNHRTQLPNETTFEYLEAIETLASRAGYNNDRDNNALKVIEVFTNNVPDNNFKRDLLKLQLNSKRKNRSPSSTLRQIKDTIKTSEASDAILDLMNDKPNIKNANALLRNNEHNF